MTRQRVAMAFVTADDEILLVRLPARATAYPGRYTTPSGPIAPGESGESAARRALAAEVGVTGAELIAAGLPLEFSDSIRKKTLLFRIHPYLFRITERTALGRLAGARWVAADQLVIASAQLETVPDLDEALARVWDPPDALPPPFRAEAKSIFTDRHADTLDLAARAAALVAAGAPAERVAALRPARARLVHIARAAVHPERDILGEAARAAAGAAAFAAGRLAAGRCAIFGPIPGLARAGGSGPFALEDEILLGAEAVTATGDVVAHQGALALAEAAAARPRPARVIVVADELANWPDEIPPPLEPGLELVPCSLVTSYASRSSSFLA